MAIKYAYKCDLEVGTLVPVLVKEKKILKEEVEETALIKSNTWPK